MMKSAIKILEKLVTAIFLATYATLAICLVLVLFAGSQIAMLFGFRGLVKPGISRRQVERRSNVELLSPAPMPAAWTDENVVQITRKAA